MVLIYWFGDRSGYVIILEVVGKICVYLWFEIVVELVLVVGEVCVVRWLF